MKNHQYGIDISKEKVNICIRGGKKNLQKSESPNTVASIKSKLADRDMLLDDCKRYVAKLHDQKGFMDSIDYAQKSSLWTAVIKVLNKQMALLDEQLDALVASDENTSCQVELLNLMDIVGGNTHEGRRIQTVL